LDIFKATYSLPTQFLCPAAYFKNGDTQNHPISIIKKHFYSYAEGVFWISKRDNLWIIALWFRLFYLGRYKLDTYGPKSDRGGTSIFKKG